MMKENKRLGVLWTIIQETHAFHVAGYAICTSILLFGCGMQEKHQEPTIPIHEAVVTGNLKMIQAHIESGSDLNERDSLSRSTPLITAATFGRPQIAQALIKAGAKIDLKNKDGSTALITAAFFCHTEIVETLLTHGADTQLRNNMGATALNTVEGPWEMTKPIYDLVGGMLEPVGLVLDYKRIQATRPVIAEKLRSLKVPDVSPPTAPEFEVKTIEPRGDENYLHLDSDYLFDQEKLPTFELETPGSALAKIDADPSAEAYVEGSLTFEGETISPVGIRYKGSVGAWVGCLSGVNFAEPSGHKICNKLSMKIKINWNGSDQTFYGLKKIQLHSQNLDPSQMRERLGYWLFRQMGVPAPRSIHARLLINGTYSGLYALTEQIDGRFTKYHFENGDGNLYKEVWPIQSNGDATNASQFLNHLKTNEDNHPNVDIIQSFALELASADSKTKSSTLSKWLDIRETITYAVVDRAIRHDDGPFHWYCQGDTCFNHNYYWYEDPVEKRLHLIPWDLDSAFENNSDQKNPITAIADDWGEVTANGKPFAYGPFNIPQRSAAADKLIAGLTEFKATYKDVMADFLAGPFSRHQVDTVLNAWIEQIRPATKEAAGLHDDAVSETEWEHAIQRLRMHITRARNAGNKL